MHVLFDETPEHSYHDGRTGQYKEEDGKWSGQGSISSHRFNDPNEKGPWGVKEGANGELLTNMVNQAYITDNSVIRDRVIDKSRAERVQKKIHGVRSMSELDSLFITSNTTDVSLSSIGLRNEIRASEMKLRTGCTAIGRSGRSACPTQQSRKKQWLSMKQKVKTMSDVPPACRIFTRYLIEDWLRNFKEGSDLSSDAEDDGVTPARKSASCLRLMFHDCGNEGNGGLTWDNDLGTLLPSETGCDASILFSKEQLSIPGNHGRVIKTAEVLYDNVYTHVNDELEAFQFLKDPTGRFSGEQGFCETMCKERWCGGASEASGSGSFVDAAENNFFELFYYSEADDPEAKPRDLPSETEIQAKWCGGDCVKRCERHVFKGVRIKNRDGTAECKVSMADIIQMAAVQGVRYTSDGNVDIVGDVQWGRCDADTNNALDLPDAFESSVDKILHAYPALGNYRSYVALLGSHTIGKAREFNNNQFGVMNNKEFDLDSTTSTFDNVYFKGVTKPLEAKFTTMCSQCNEQPPLTQQCNSVEVPGNADPVADVVAPQRRLLNTITCPRPGPHKLSNVRSVARSERQVPEEMLGRHIATDPHDPHCVTSRQCYGDSTGSTILDVCNPNINSYDPISMTILNGNDVCGAFWTDELSIATCGTRPHAERYAEEQQDFFKDYKCAHLHLAHTPCLSYSTFNYDTMSAADRQYCQEQHMRIPGAWTRRVSQLNNIKAVGGVPMVQVITPTALGHVGFEMDLRGCDHFDDSDLALWFVGRYNAPLDNTCDRVCALITAYNEMNLDPAYHFPFNEVTGEESPGGDIKPQDEGWKLQVSCPGVEDLVLENTEDKTWWKWWLQPGQEGLVTVTACFEQEDFTDDDVGKVVLSEINDGKPCEYTIHGPTELHPPPLERTPLVKDFKYPTLRELKEELDPLPKAPAHIEVLRVR